MRRPGAALLFALLPAFLPAFLIAPDVSASPPVPAAEAPSTDLPDNRWVQVDTDHFRVIYRERDEAAAREVLALADRVWRDTTRHMTYRPRERVPVVIYGNTARANGFFTPYPPHIALFVSSPVGPWLGARTRSWIETVFVHELIHYLHLTQPIGFFGSPSRIFGPLLASAGTVFMPGWAVEGVAVHGESHLAPGGRGDNPFFEMQAVAPILENRMYSYDQAGFSSPYAPYGRIYTAGFLMVDYLRREYGDDAFTDLNRRFQQAPFLGMRRAIRLTTGIPAREFFHDMVVDLQEQYNWRRELPRGTGISPPGPGNWFLPVETDRGMIGWALDYDRGPGLYLWEPTADMERNWRLLAPVAPAEEWSWTVDRSGGIAVVSLGSMQGGGLAPATGESYADLFLLELPADGETGRKGDRHRPVPSRRITTGRRLFHPALAPGGDRLAALERRGSYTRLVEVDLDTGEVRPLWEPDRTTLSALSYSPCGSLLVLTANDRGRQDVVVLDAKTGRERARLAPDELGAYHFPRILERPERELWYGGEDGRELALYRSLLAEEDESLHISAPQLVLRDRVAAWAGFPLAHGTEEATAWDRGHEGHEGHENVHERRTVYYGSYTADGYSVKRAEIALPRLVRPAPPPGDHPPPTLDPVAGPVDPAAAPVAPAIPPGIVRPYRDIPRPVLWLPQAFYRSGGEDEGQFDLGVFATAASNLGRHTVDVSVLYNPSAHQPSGLLQYTWAPGRTRWSVLLAQEYRTYRDPPVTELTSSAGVFATRSLWIDQRPGFHRALAGGAGAEYRSVALTPGSSSFTSVLEDRETRVSQEIEYRLLLRLLRARTGAPRDFFGPPAREVTTRLDLGPRIESTTGAIMRMHPLRRVSGPAGALQVVPAAYLTTSDAGAAPERLPYRSGGFTEKKRADTAGLGRIEIRVPLGLHDAAWRGFATTGSGIGVYLEQAVAGMDYAVTGMEVTMDLFFNMVPLRMTGGAALRVPHPGSAVEEDWLLYLRLGGPGADVLRADHRPLPR
ncbi:MAG: hypothetical protein EA427_10110 [Spirochaetaceae bacterium]|nr:MAG: hypothetical protein EA427_10110 [Spirochaetaceae bacterium]